MSKTPQKKKGVQRAIALTLVAAAIVQMVSLAFAKPQDK